jgi:hypothetical protein
MRQEMRQLGIVIGLTAVLTFPVTMVSGAGSQKHVRGTVRTGVKVVAQVQGVSRGETKGERNFVNTHR